jgi:hypothetical protein
MDCTVAQKWKVFKMIILHYVVETKASVPHEFYRNNQRITKI